MHPVTWLAVAKPLIMVFAALAGRQVRNFYKSLRIRDRRRIHRQLKKFWYYPAGIAAFLVIMSLLYILIHLERTPITGRLRFVIFEDDDSEAGFVFHMKGLKNEYEGYLLSRNKSTVKSVRNLTNNIIKANKELSERGNWTVYLVEDKSANAYVLQSKLIFVYEGLLKVVDSTDQLAFVLGHEMAHVVLKHSSEIHSVFSLIDNVFVLCLFGIWCLSPTVIHAFGFSWMCDLLLGLLVCKPHSRYLEIEADQVGLMFAVKACYDFRAGVTFWEKQARFANTSHSFFHDLFLSHPDEITRAMLLRRLKEPAKLWRSENEECPSLTET